MLIKKYFNFFFLCFFFFFAAYKHFEESEIKDPRVTDNDQIELWNNNIIRSDNGDVSQIGVVGSKVETDKKS